MEIYFIVNRIRHGMQILSETYLASMTSKWALSRVNSP